MDEYQNLATLAISNENKKHRGCYSKTMFLKMTVELYIEEEFSFSPKFSV